MCSTGCPIDDFDLKKLKTKKYKCNDFRNESKTYEKNKLYNQSLYYYNIIYNLTKDKKINKKIKNITNKINY